MKFVIQRVTEASVEVEHKIVGKIGKGYLVFVGVGQGDTEEIADRYLKSFSVSAFSKTKMERPISL